MSAKAQDAALQQQCLFGTEASHCGATATVHVLQLDRTPTMSCPDHVDWWFEHGFTDMHPIDPTCGMPSCLWIWSSPGSPGRCVVEGLNVDEPAAGAAPEQGPPRRRGATVLAAVVLALVLTGCRDLPAQPPSTPTATVPTAADPRALSR